ncbi:MAG: DUF6446 family protein [Shimia sp.]
MSGKLVGLFILIATAAVAGGVYYAQIYGFYDIVEQEGVALTTLEGDVEPIPFDGFEAIDAESSPIRYRACFDTDLRLPLMTVTYALYEGAEPLNAPGWFDCFDADAIAAELRAGTALAFVGERNFEFGIDRIVVVTDAGRGFVWHQVNDCGDRLYDGSAASDDCPERP